MRLKENIKELVGGIEKISKLRGVKFDWIEESVHNVDGVKGGDAGFIAQEVNEVLPELTNIMNQENGTMQVNYAKMTSVLISALREQREIVKEYTDKLEIIKLNRSK